MASLPVPKPSGHRKIDVLRLQDVLRGELVAHYRQSQQYQTEVTAELWSLRRAVQRSHDLNNSEWRALWLLHAPLTAWERFCLESWRSGKLSTVFLEYDRIVELASEPAVAQYLAGVLKRVNGCGLLHNGMPTDWARDFIHSDTLRTHWGPSQDRPYSLWEHLYGIDQEFTIRLKGSAGFATIHSSSKGLGADYGKLDWAPFHSQQTIADQAEPYVYWPELEATAHRHLQQMLNSLRDSMEVDTVHPISDTRSAARLEEKRHALELLFRHLYYNRPIPPGAEREAVRRLAREIEIDFPKKK